MLRRGSWTSRVTAVAILVLALFAAHRFMVTPVVERFAANEQQILQKSKLLQHYQALETTGPALTDRLAAIQSQDRTAGGYWEGASAVLTGAKLQDRVSRSVDAHGGNMISVQTLGPGDADETSESRQTRLQARFGATVDGLASILHDIESATPYMFVDRLTVTSNRPRRGGGGADTAHRESRLDVRMDVFGYVREDTALSGGAGEADG